MDPRIRIHTKMSWICSNLLAIFGAFCYLDCFESIVAEVQSYELELGGECLLGEEVGGERVVGQVQQQQALQALHVTT